MNPKTMSRSAAITGLFDELKRVSWPSRQETMRLTAVVIVISLIIGLYVGIIDVGLAKLLELFTKVK